MTPKAIAQLKLADSVEDLPVTLAGFRDRHCCETILICGCGSSLNELTNPGKFITIGVNDVGRKFDPTYLVVLNPRRQFKNDRFRYVEQSRARVIFTQLDLGIRHPHIVRFKLGQRGGTDFSNPNVLHYTRNSPYVALCLAIHMGATKVGLIGLDFTEHHFFAKTGRHALSGSIDQINDEYAGLSRECRRRGIEVINLSEQSRLTAFPKGTINTLQGSHKSSPVNDVGGCSDKRVFFVNYRFLSCGEVFTTGLRNAARELGIQAQEACWDDPMLLERVKKFIPDLLFVVHGRRFVQRWRNGFDGYKSAVWLLDEPYEVDDTAKWSKYFDTVFVNDRNTLDCHTNAHYLPVAYDPCVNRDSDGERKYEVGFVGGYNRTRESALLKLLDAGLLSYVVGGPWKDSRLRAICLSQNIPAEKTTALYQQTRIVVNVFRDQHHFNRRSIPGWSLNPRVYEALACGALVVSERRSEAESVFPELPLFDNTEEMVAKVHELLHDKEKYTQLLKHCRSRLAQHTYERRLLSVLKICEVGTMETVKVHEKEAICIPCVEADETIGNQPDAAQAPPGWTAHGRVLYEGADGNLILRKTHDDGAGTELGIASERAYTEVELSFEVSIAADACFIAKVHQEKQLDQGTNSYHLFCHPRQTYLAMHNRVLRQVRVARGRWERLVLRRTHDRVELEIGGRLVACVREGTLSKGYCFMGLKGGEVRIRNVAIKDLRDMTASTSGLPSCNVLPEYDVLHGLERQKAPTVSIITTVYDRVHCLRECIHCVQRLQYRDYEHIIVSDHPPPHLVDAILSFLEAGGHNDVIYANLRDRHNNWGIAPASVGLHLARGHYVCFLSDDNGYSPDHLGPLVDALERDPAIGFAYSSCQYAGRLVLRGGIPRPAAIDLGQPLFRKSLFDRHLPGPLPFDMMAWDWYMIETFMRKGERWRHIDRPSFLFRLDACRKRRRA